MGTLDELFEAITLVQTEKIKKIPIILVNIDYWTGLLDWLKNTLLAQGMINEENLSLIQLVETKEEVLKILEEFYPNEQ